MKFLIIGCGSIGRRHAKNLRHMGHEVAGADILLENRKWVQEGLGARAFATVDEGLKWQPDAALVCTPTSTHLRIAMQALRGGCHVFIEKPVSGSEAGIEALAKEAKKQKAVALCACNLRFSTAVNRMKELLEAGAIGKVLYARAQYGNYLPSLRQGDYRKTYAAKKGQGGGILLDDVHELDYLRWLLGGVKEAACMAANASGLRVEAEDSADVLLRFRSGAVASIHSDYFQRTYQRTCELVGEKGTISWQDHKGILSYFLALDKEKGWQEEKLPVAGYENDMYVKEMRHFIACIEGREEPMCGIADAAAVLGIAIAAKKAAKSGKTVKLK